MEYCLAADRDLGLLAEWNHHLLRDEGHRNPMTVPGLRERMKGGLGDEYTAVIFGTTAEPVASALCREKTTEVSRRQLFVRRDRRREGIGRTAVAILRNHLWPRHKRWTVEVLTATAPAGAFWRSIGYKDYCLTLEILPEQDGEQSAAADVRPRAAEQQPPPPGSR
ncbi:MAG: GNAT family N-acetyltransferase [Candidatus Methylomirabilales bacterium]